MFIEGWKLYLSVTAPWTVSALWFSVFTFHSVLLSTVRDVTGTVSDRCLWCLATSGVLCSLQLWKELTAVVAAGSCGMWQLLEWVHCVVFRAGGVASIYVNICLLVVSVHQYLSP